MTFVESVSTCLKKYAAFEGTASRSEFWWFMLFQFLAGFIASFLSTKLYFVVWAGLFIPSIAVAARRLHDTDRSGWMQLIGVIPVIGWIAVIIFYTQEGKPNRYETAASDIAHVA